MNKREVICNSSSQGEGFFKDNFSCNINLEETGYMEESLNDYWWVNSGAYLIQENGAGSTLYGELEEGSEWQKKYKDYNASETDDGFHPQNIFRLVTRSKWLDYTQEAQFKIDEYILSEDGHRSESNGILLFNRYLDGDNLYYTGLRVDGAAVIKKKYKGKYYTMDYRPILMGKYDMDSNPNLIPVGEWIGVRSVVKNMVDGQVKIELYIKLESDAEWILAAEAIDDGVAFGGYTIATEGYAGIRTDFMDAAFDDYRIEENQ